MEKVARASAPAPPFPLFRMGLSEEGPTRCISVSLLPRAMLSAIAGLDGFMNWRIACSALLLAAAMLTGAVAADEGNPAAEFVPHWVGMLRPEPGREEHVFTMQIPAYMHLVLDSDSLEVVDIWTDVMRPLIVLNGEVYEEPPLTEPYARDDGTIGNLNPRIVGRSSGQEIKLDDVRNLSARLANNGFIDFYDSAYGIRVHYPAGQGETQELGYMKIDRPADINFKRYLGIEDGRAYVGYIRYKAEDHYITEYLSQEVIRAGLDGDDVEVFDIGNVDPCTIRHGKVYGMTRDLNAALKCFDNSEPPSRIAISKTDDLTEFTYYDIALEVGESLSFVFPLQNDDTRLRVITRRCILTYDLATQEIVQSLEFEPVLKDELERLSAG